MPQGDQPQQWGGRQGARGVVLVGVGYGVCWALGTVAALGGSLVVPRNSRDTSLGLVLALQGSHDGRRELAWPEGDM